MVLKLDLNDEEMLSRILKRGEGRSDDDEHIARNRISEFRRSEPRIDKCIKATLGRYSNIVHSSINTNQTLDRTVRQLMKIAGPAS